MLDSRLRELLLEAELSSFQSPEERIKTVVECISLAIKLQRAAKQSVDFNNES